MLTHYTNTYMSQIIMLYTLNPHNIPCQFFLIKAGRKKIRIPREMHLLYLAYHSTPALIISGTW